MRKHTAWDLRIVLLATFIIFAASLASVAAEGQRSCSSEVWTGQKVEWEEFLRKAEVVSTEKVGLVNPPQTHSYDPARLESGSVAAIPYQTRAAGIVLFELVVDPQGNVTETRIIQDLAPFTRVVKESVNAWRFDPARVNRKRAKSRVLVAGLFRPAMLHFPMPKAVRAPDAQPSEEVPFPTSFKVPPYPPNAIGSAYVLVEVEVGKDGTVNSTEVHGPSSGFDDAALQAASAWSFRPASREGRPVPARAYLIFAFRQPV